MDSLKKSMLDSLTFGLTDTADARRARLTAGLAQSLSIPDPYTYTRPAMHMSDRVRTVRSRVKRAMPFGPGNPNARVDEHHIKMQVYEIAAREMFGKIIDQNLMNGQFAVSNEAMGPVMHLHAEMNIMVRPPESKHKGQVDKMDGDALPASEWRNGNPKEYALWQMMKVAEDLVAGKEDRPDVVFNSIMEVVDQLIEAGYGRRPDMAQAVRMP